jgi:hypothetical protein
VAKSKELTAEELLAEDIGSFFDDPYGFVMYAFPWGEPGTALEHYDGPDEWQTQFLQDWGEAIRERGFDGVNPVDAYMDATASGHGIGKGLSCDSVTYAIRNGKYLTLKAGERKVGDKLFSKDGSLTTVTGVNRYKRDHYLVTFDDGSSIEVSGEHEWNVKGRNERRKGIDRWRTMETQEIIEAGVKRSNGKSLARQWEIPVQGAAEIPAAEQDVDPYFMGLWIGDGSANSNRYCKPYDELYQKLLSRCVNVRKHGDTVSIIGANLSADIFTRNSFDRYIPDEYKYASLNQRMSLFEGLCDSDGEVNKSGSIGYSTTSKRLADDIVWLARSLGCKAMLQPTTKKGWYRKDGVKIECKDCYRVTINSPFNPFTLKHRRDSYKPSEQRYLKRWIESIEPTGLKDGICVEVDTADSLYQEHDFIVTHNSALSSMIILFIMSTRPFSRGVVTANTSDQLRTKTWGELAKWKGLCICGHWFTYNNGKGNMNLYHPEYKDTWRVDAQVCREENSEAFAGLHAAGSTPWYLFDEASAVPDKIWEVSEGGLTDGEPFWFVFGNPTRNTGRFRECWRKFKHRWHTRQVDSRQARMTNKKKIAEWEKDYGEDSDFFKVRVRGVFPSAGSLQFIPVDLVDDGLKVVLTEQMVSHAPVIIGVDPAYSGEDEFVIYLRQGLHCKMLGQYEKSDDDVKMARVIADFEDKYKADAVFIDFGYGTGVKSVGSNWGREWQLVAFGGKSSDPQMENKRGEMWNAVKSWLKDGGQVDSQELADELTAPEYKVKLNGKIVLESKEDMKRRGVPSPNRADALALTFAYPVLKKDVSTGQAHKAETEYDPWDN